MRDFAYTIAVRLFGREEPIAAWERLDEGKLESALAGPRPVFGQEVYPTLAAKAAVLLYGIAKAHSLPNGNKRLAMTSTFLFLYGNDMWWQAEGEEIRAHVTWVAASESQLRSVVLDYLTGYFERRLVPAEDAPTES